MRGPTRKRPRTPAPRGGPGAHRDDGKGAVAEFLGRREEEPRDEALLQHLVRRVGPVRARPHLHAEVAHLLLHEAQRLQHLLGLEAVRKGYYTKFNANGLLRGSVQARGAFYTQLYNIGVINPNEIRALEEMNPYDGGEKYRVPLNMVDPTDETDPAAPGGADPKP